MALTNKMRKFETKQKSSADKLIEHVDKYEKKSGALSDLFTFFKGTADVLSYIPSPIQPFAKAWSLVDDAVYGGLQQKFRPSKKNIIGAEDTWTRGTGKSIADALTSVEDDKVKADVMKSITNVVSDIGKKDSSFKKIFGKEGRGKIKKSISEGLTKAKEGIDEGVWHLQYNDLFGYEPPKAPNMSIGSDPLDLSLTQLTDLEDFIPEESLIATRRSKDLQKLGYSKNDISNILSGNLDNVGLNIPEENIRRGGVSDLLNLLNLSKVQEKGDIRTQVGLPQLSPKEFERYNIENALSSLGWGQGRNLQNPKSLID